jgi:hypothetical protein
MYKTKFRTRVVSAAVAICVLGTTLPLSALAGMVSTEEVAASQAQEMRAQVLQTLQRDEVKQALAERGVAPASVVARIDALTDSEVLQLKQQIDSAPAGASDILGIVFTIFLILLITDILGLTKVFPFTRSVR